MAADLYALLQVHPAADPDVIRAAYRVLARKNHPDFGGDPAHMASLNEAWDVLGDTERRAAYDRALGRPETAEFAGPLARRGHRNADSSLLDFGRYIGWSIEAVAAVDPDYLEWLGRTPAGRPLKPRIDDILGRQASAAEALRPVAATGRR
jgi:curved DNA-binding protein CbpA